MEYIPSLRSAKQLSNLLEKKLCLQDFLPLSNHFLAAQKYYSIVYLFILKNLTNPPALVFYQGPDNSMYQKVLRKLSILL